MKRIIVASFFSVFLLKYGVIGTNYCDTNLCEPNEKHIGCKNNNNFADKCQAKRSLVPMTPDLKTYLLQKHNQARRDIANGKITGYASANRMIEMTWDEELAKLAEYNAKSCIFGHDECRNTYKYKYAGQNIAYSWSPVDYYDFIGDVDYLFGLWFDEKEDCDMTYIDKFRRSDTNKKIGHFTQVVLAGAKKVGCALATFSDSGKDSGKTVYLVCDYSLVNIVGRPIYTTGTPCSACTKGCSSTYPGLCDSSEIMPPL